MIKDRILKEDIDQLLVNERRIFEALGGCTILVTGATGLIGSFVIYALSEFNKQYGGHILPVALVRNREKAESMFQGCEIGLLVQDITEPIKTDKEIDYIIHGASVTASREFVEHPLETIRLAVKGTENIIDLAIRKNVKGLLYLSSLEIYGSYEGNDERIISETEYGILDPLNIRNSYPESKKLCENLCAAAVSEAGVHARIARLTQTFGAGVSYSDSRVFAEFARCAIEGQDIVLHTKGETVRDYCYIADAVAGLFYILLHGADGQAYNVANESTAISIYDMAKLAAGLSNEDISVIIRDDVSDSMGYNPVMKVILSSAKLRQLGWTAKYDIREMFVRLIESMKSRR